MFVVALVHVFVGTSSSPLDNLEVVFPNKNSPNFYVTLSGHAWLIKSGPMAFRDGDSWYFSSNNNSLKLDNADSVKQEGFVAWNFTWVAGGQEDSIIPNLKQSWTLYSASC